MVNWTVLAHEWSPHTTTWLPAFSNALLINIFTTGMVCVNSDLKPPREIERSSTPLTVFCKESSSTSTSGTVLTHDQSAFTAAMALKLLTQSVSTNFNVCHAIWQRGAGRTSGPSSRLATATRDAHRPPMMTMLGGLSARGSMGESLKDVNTSRISVSAIQQRSF